MKIKIGNKFVGDDCPTYVVAEMSANHSGYIKNAFKIIKEAKDAGADAIKIQSYEPDTITLNSNSTDFLIDKKSPWADYKNLWNLYDIAKTPFNWHKDLFDYAKSINIDIFSTPFDETSVDLLEHLNVPAYKIASPEIINIPLLKKVALTKKPIIISTGACNSEELDVAMETLRGNGAFKIIILKCTSAYPSPLEEMNIRTMSYYKEKYNTLVGLSDHSLGPTASICSVALGASLIEKHYKLTDVKSVDSFFSIDKNEFKELITSIRNAEKILGRVIHLPSETSGTSLKGRSSIYVVDEIRKGETLSKENLKVIRPGFSLHPKFYEQILGKKVNKDLMKGSRINLDDILI